MFKFSLIKKFAGLLGVESSLQLTGDIISSLEECRRASELRETIQLFRCWLTSFPCQRREFSFRVHPVTLSIVCQTLARPDHFPRVYETLHRHCRNQPPRTLEVTLNFSLIPRMGLSFKDSGQTYLCATFYSSYDNVFFFYSMRKVTVRINVTFYSVFYIC